MWQPRVLLTGFANEKFGSTNPSMVVAEKCEALSGGGIVARELPIDYGDIRRSLEDNLEAVRPIGVICLGVAMHRAELSIEDRAFNYRQDTRDGGRTLLTSGRWMYHSTLPNSLIVMRARAQGYNMYQATQQETQPAQQCNAAMYHSLALTSRRSSFRDTVAGFIHVPLSNEQAAVAGAEGRLYSGMSIEDMAAGVLIAAETVLETNRV